MSEFTNRISTVVDIMNSYFLENDISNIEAAYILEAVKDMFSQKNSMIFAKAEMGRK